MRHVPAGDVFKGVAGFDAKGGYHGMGGHGGDQFPRYNSNIRREQNDRINKVLLKQGHSLFQKDEVDTGLK